MPAAMSRPWLSPPVLGSSPPAATMDVVVDDGGAAAVVLVVSELDEVGASVLDEVGASVLDEVGASVLDEVGASVLDEVGASVLDEVGASVLDEVGASVLDEVGASVLDEVGASVLDEVGASVLDEVGASVLDEVGASVLDEVGASVLDEVGASVLDEVGASVLDEVGASVVDVVVGGGGFQQTGDVTDGALRRRKIDADRRGRLEGVEDSARTSLHKVRPTRDVRFEAEERRAALDVDVEDLHHEAGFLVGEGTFLRQLAGHFDLELEGEVTQVAAILVAVDDGARRCWRRPLWPCYRAAPNKAGRSQHHADQAGDSASPTID